MKSLTHKDASPDAPPPASETTPASWFRSSPGDPPATRPPLSRLPATLLRPLSREGRALVPLYYLVTARTRIRRAPKAAPFSEKMRRHCEGAAIALFWPIGRALTLFWLWRDPPCLQSARLWWRANTAARHSHNPHAAPSPCAEPSSPPDQEHKGAAGHWDQRPCRDLSTPGSQMQSQPDGGTAE